MTNLKNKGDWERIKKYLMEKYPSLTDRDFENKDHEEKLLNHLSQKVGTTSYEMREIIREI